MNISFTVNTRPFPQPRPRIVKGHAFEPKRITDYKHLIRTLAKTHMRATPPLDKDVSITLIFRKHNPTDSIRFGDADNLAKAVMDALNGVCYIDDALVKILVVVKQQSIDEGIDISISELLSN